MVFADDAEYIGTNGWFRLKYRNEPDNVFERIPEANERLVGFIEGCLQTGGFATFDEACNSLPPLDDLLMFDDDSAWHGAQASTWAGTPMAQLLRPWQDLVRQKLLAASDGKMESSVRRLAWFHLTNSYNSDGQWPPTLPDAPHIVHPFNYAYCFDNLLQAELLVGGVDRGRLTTDPVATVVSILGPQQELILEKAAELARSGRPEDVENSRLAVALVQRSRDVRSIGAADTKVLYPSEYRSRADALVAARCLVGGIEIERVANA